MYLPRHFEESRTEVVHEMIRAHPFGALVTLADSGLEANHIPFLLVPEPAPLGSLHGHLARANGQWRTFSPTMEALVLFQGPEHYITPAWYPTKAETGKVVPTWNYTVVHAYGQIRIREEREWLHRHVAALTAQHESGRAAPWAVSDAPSDFVDALLQAIVGVEIRITRLLGKRKLSQNRSEADREGAARGLDSEGSRAAAALADRMRRPNQ